MTTTSSEAEWEDVELNEHEAEESDISPTTRAICYRRDEYRCRNCGEMETTKLTLHHVIFRSQGGTHRPDNLVTVCWSCHRLIHDKVLTVIRRLGEWFFGDRRHWRHR